MDIERQKRLKLIAGHIVGITLGLVVALQQPPSGLTLKLCGFWEYCLGYLRLGI
jgi:uncharacterized membrane protein YccC